MMGTEKKKARRQGRRRPPQPNLPPSPPPPSPPAPPAKTNLPTAQVPKPPRGFDAFVASLKGKRLALFLDYDGTLTPIVRDPDRAFLSDATRAAVEAAAAAFPAAIVSGRGREKVEEFVKLPELYLRGQPRDGHRGTGPEQQQLRRRRRRRRRKEEAAPSPSAAPGCRGRRRRKLLPLRRPAASPSGPRQSSRP